MKAVIFGVVSARVAGGNGMSLCRLHHATFDRRLLLGVYPSYVIHVRKDILEERWPVFGINPAATNATPASASRTWIS